MKHSVVGPRKGTDYEWSGDHVYIQTPMELTDGRVTVVEDFLKPGFHLARHHHRLMVEIFVILEGELIFTFDSETITATPGTTVTVPPGVWHEALAPTGARIITVFTPGGFDHYLADLSAMGEKLEDEDAVKELGHRYDIWPE